MWITILALGRARFPFAMGGMELSVFPAFAGILILISSTQVLGAEIPDSSRPPANRKPMVACSAPGRAPSDLLPSSALCAKGFRVTDKSLL